MQITITNVKTTLAPQNIDPSNDNDMNALTNVVVAVFPDFEGWSYNSDTDILYVVRPNQVISAPSLGEVYNVDYTVG